MRRLTAGFFALIVAAPASPQVPESGELAPQDIEILTRLDNPGDWLFHCHVLEHMHAGMNTLIRVT